MESTVPFSTYSDIRLFSNENVCSVQFYDSGCVIFQENGYHCRVPFSDLPTVMKEVSFSETVRFNAFSRVSDVWFENDVFWKKTLKNTTKIYVHGPWSIDGLCLLVCHLPNLIKICCTYWECKHINRLLTTICENTKCEEIVMDMRGITEPESDIFQTLTKLPEQLVSLFIILKEYFSVINFKEIQKIVKAKMGTGSQAVILFDRDFFDCINHSFLLGSLSGFRFNKSEPCHIASYSRHLNMYKAEKNFDAFSIYHNIHQDVSFIVGARIAVNNGCMEHISSDSNFDGEENIESVLPCTTELVKNEYHIENEQSTIPVNTGRNVLPKTDIHYSTPEPLVFHCCSIESVSSCYKNCRGKGFTYGAPAFRRARYLDQMRTKCQFLFKNDERICEMVYFPNHIELHFDNGFITRPDVDELFFLRMFQSTPHLIVHSTSAERYALEAISFTENLFHVNTIEFRGPWWGRLLYEFISRRSLELQKFYCLCFQSQRGSLLEFWHHHGGNKKQEHPIPQITHLSFDARDCKFDNLYDILRAFVPENRDESLQKEKNILDNVTGQLAMFEELDLIVSKIAHPKIAADRYFDFNQIFLQILKFTVPGAKINLAILNNLPKDERNVYNYVDEYVLENCVLHMKHSGVTLIPHIYNKCSVKQPDFVLKSFTSKKCQRNWHIAIPFDC